ncbi:type IV secretory system conjugative DNA transfer family protein [Francisella adeliensis]|uniref:type IV secretory system conjugative DNA transfer family protein n=1 Tax=Francisella adeliensis TaxID=2007306 RepID=UPI0019039EA2|nr:TraM recognition domain-containing protein [Francisella adeliensis]MBK2085925.1 type IV secretion system DNA-binding domain-containing protein [Francisella adeliensis]
MDKEKKGLSFKSYFALVGLAISMIFSIWGTFAGIVLYFCRKLLYISDIDGYNRIMITAVFGGCLVFCCWWWSLFSYNLFDVVVSGFWYELHTIQGWLGTHQYSGYGFLVYLKHYTHLFCFSMFFFPIYFFWLNELTKDKVLEAIKKSKKKEKADKKEISPKKVKEETKKGFAWVLSTGLPFNIVVSDFKQNGIFFGTTGAGKTVTIFGVTVLFLSKKMPLIFIDGKGDDNNLKDENGEIVHSEDKKYKILEKLAKKTGQKLYTWNCGNFDKWDFLAVGTPSEIKDKIIGLGIGADSSASEFYSDNDDVLLLVIIMLLNELGEKITIPNILELCDLNSIKEVAKDKAIKDETKQKIKLINHIKQEHISGLKNKLLKLYMSDFYKYLDGGFNLREVIQNNDIVYFSLPNVTSKKSAEMLGQLAINDYKTCIQFNHTKKPVGLILDEFAVFCGEQAIELVTQTRSMGGHTLMAAQDVSNLAKKTSWEYVGTMINNCNLLLVQRLNNSDDREFLGKQFGTYSAFDTTLQIGQDSLGDAKSTTGAGSVRNVNKFRVHPDDIANLKTGQGYIKKTMGDKFVHSQKIQINNNLNL